MPIRDLSPDLQKKYREMRQLEFQFQVFKARLKDVERAKIESFKADMNVLQVIKNRVKKVKIKKEKNKFAICKKTRRNPRFLVYPDII